MKFLVQVENKVSEFLQINTKSIIGIGQRFFPVPLVCNDWNDRGNMWSCVFDGIGDEVQKNTLHIGGIEPYTLQARKIQVQFRPCVLDQRAYGVLNFLEYGIKANLFKFSAGNIILFEGINKRIGFFVGN